MDIGKNKMRSVALQLDGAEIDFAGEPEIFRARIVDEQLGRSRQCGMAAAAKRVALKSAKVGVRNRSTRAKRSIEIRSARQVRS